MAAPKRYSAGMVAQLSVTFLLAITVVISSASIAPEHTHVQHIDSPGVWQQRVTNTSATMLENNPRTSRHHTTARTEQWRLAGLESASLTLYGHDNSKRDRFNMGSRPNLRSNCPFDCKCGLITGVTCYSPSANAFLPETFPRGIQVLTIYGYKNIRQELQDLDELKELSIYDGRLTSPPALPKSLNNLRIINSNLKDLSDINRLTYLRSLNAAHNNITEVDLSKLTNLLSLDLSHNPLIKVPELAISVTILILKYTYLNDQPTTWEVYLPNLRHLVLAGIHTRQPPYLDLPRLEYLDLSHSRIGLLPYLSKLPSLREINLSHAKIYNALPNHFRGPTNLQKVDLSYTHVSKLPDKLFIHNPNLKEIYIHNSDLNYIKDYTLSGLRKLEHLILRDNPELKNIDDISMSTLTNLKILDLSNTSVRALPISLNNVNLTHLNADNVTILCDCHSHWLPAYLEAVQGHTRLSGFSPIKCSDGKRRTVLELKQYLSSLKCAAPDILSPPDATLKRGAGKTALLDCNATGQPSPLIIWHSPDKKYYMYQHTEVQPWFSDKLKYMISHVTDCLSDPPIDPRIQPLRSGQLLIQNMTQGDVGLYRCIAVNPVASIMSTTKLWLTTHELEAFKFETLLFGLACAMTFLLTTLIVQLVRYIMDRMGWECCCCRGRISSKAQQVRRLLESVESYKSQQLEKLRENYNGQVVTIKESCYQQMERLSESYAQQCKNLQNIKDYSAQQLTTARDQYLDQINRVRDYSVGQMNKVGENYVFQRQRIRKFSAHQLFKLRETYKYQQKTLNKILENIPDLYLQNCRTGGSCNRSSESIIFDDEIRGLDAYYKLDFLNPIMTSTDGSEDFYYTPSSTLTRVHKQYIIQQHRRQHSNCSTSASTNEYQEAVQSWATNTPVISPSSSPSHLMANIISTHNQSRQVKHTRSLSISAAKPSGSSSSYIPTHRRTLSANTNINPALKIPRSSPPINETAYCTPLARSPSEGETVGSYQYLTNKDSIKERSGTSHSANAIMATSPNQDSNSEEQPVETTRRHSHPSQSDFTELTTASQDDSDNMNHQRNSDVSETDTVLDIPKVVNDKSDQKVNRSPKNNKKYIKKKATALVAEVRQIIIQDLNLDDSVSPSGINSASNDIVIGNQPVVTANVSISPGAKVPESSEGLVAGDSCATETSDNDYTNTAREARLNTFSREGSKESVGRFVLPPVTEDKEPTPSSSEATL